MAVVEGLVPLGVGPVACRVVRPAGTVAGIGVVSGQPAHARK